MGSGRPQISSLDYVLSKFENPKNINMWEIQWNPSEKIPKTATDYLFWTINEYPTDLFTLQTVKRSTKSVVLIKQIPYVIYYYEFGHLLLYYYIIINEDYKL